MSSPIKVIEFPVEEEYKKDTGISPEDISQLRQWLTTQPHLPGDLISDLDLIIVYHCCHRSAEVSKQVVDLHYTLKTLFVNMFKDRTVDSKVLRTMDYLLALPLDATTREGHSVFYARVIDSDVKKFVFQDCIRVALMALDLFFYERGTFPGAVLIVDMNGVLLGHLARLDLQTMQQFLYFLQEALLAIVKSIHFMNAPSFMDKILMLVKPFLKRSFLDMIHIHQIGSCTIEEFVPIEILPKDAGGESKTSKEARDDMKTRFKENEEYFKTENKKRVVEAKRPGKPRTISDIFGGVVGSFKKLDID